MRRVIISLSHHELLLLGLRQVIKIYGRNEFIFGDCEKMGLTNEIVGVVAN
jgi:hypothetical protein